ncbi:TcmI family type II polyketide cyclase [Nocardia sp. 2YAB30]|uniref:TcmI family type II polyketide cyclase n=1 Tax=unclassified Nocardia TaxID=2637762 RepID=UPI003F99F9D0
MNRSLIIARIRPDAVSRVAEIFAESDATALPVIAGVSRRELYALDDLYVHMLETTETGNTAIGLAQQHPEFARVSSRLGEFISPYLPTWQSPADARARMFYSWTPQTGPTPESVSDVPTKWNKEK